MKEVSMEYMESRIQDQIEAGLALMEELEMQYDRFSEWYCIAFPDGDESLIDRKYLDDQFNLRSPVVEVTAMWVSWRAAVGI